MFAERGRVVCICWNSRELSAASEELAGIPQRKRGNRSPRSTQKRRSNKGAQTQSGLSLEFFLVGRIVGDRGPRFESFTSHRQPA